MIRAGRRSWDYIGHSHRWQAVSGLLSHSKHYVLSHMMWRAECSAGTIMVGRLRMRRAMRCRFWSLQKQSKGKPRPGR